MIVTITRKRPGNHTMEDIVNGRAIQTMTLKYGPAKMMRPTLTGTHGGITVNFTMETGSALTTLDNPQITRTQQTMIATYQGVLTKVAWEDKHQWMMVTIIQSPPQQATTPT